MSKKTPAYKLQAIVNDGNKWPYIGNGYLNQDGSVSLLLDRGVKLVLPGGAVLEERDGNQVKVHMRGTFRRAEPEAANE